MRPAQTRIFDDTLLTPFRQLGDPAADALVAAVVQQTGREGLTVFMRFLGDLKNASLAEQLPEVVHFFEQQGHLPPWTDPQKMAQGMAFFWKHETEIALLLGCYSLPYCYAAANGAQVLWLTERIKKDTYKRLEETGEFVFEIMQERDWRNGRNVIKVLKIRLMHAVVRYFTSHHAQWDSAWGLPINQEDMAGTNLAFSYIVVRGLRKMNVKTQTNDEESYLHFWDIIGHLLGVNERLLPVDLREAYHLDRAIYRRQFKPSTAGKGLTQALTKVLQNQVPTKQLQNFPIAQMRFLLGKEVADLLGVPEVPLEDIVVRTTTHVPFLQFLFRNNTPDSDVLKTYLRK
ncbi:hypothetical protein FHS57_005590 [Runella defluvii]|uniref:ER-bound oxygenase mpaB/mpaB'/Rubber oxygenase catalytic domain-containing protein n=1 Tax=Runella defluvii TaxID=370973 RepID=A0A7W6ETG2_9BACT|nr:oxygenase MpaB family protein [Runella defluvii]MBB3841562.1 hypothetical protein [Runella defluvii]